MQVTPVRPTGSFFQHIRQALPACMSWTRVQGAFSSLAGCFRSKPVPLTERQVTPLKEMRAQLFSEGLVEKVCSGGILKQIQHNRFEFTEYNSAPRYFEDANAFTEYLKSMVSEISFWRIELGGTDRVFYKYWDEVEGSFESYATKNALYYALSKDAGGAFKVIDKSSDTTTYVRNRSGYFTLAFQEFESEALFLETMQREKKRRAFLLKCLAGVATGAAVGAGAYAYYSHRQTEEQINVVVLPHLMAQAVSRTTFVPLGVLPNITLIEEIPYQSPTWIISDLFGSAMNGAVVSADSLPKGMRLINQPMRVVNSVSSGGVNNHWLAKNKDHYLYFGLLYVRNPIPAHILDIIDISDPLNLFTINRQFLETPFDSPFVLNDISLQGNYSYIVTLLEYQADLIIADVSDPLNFKVISKTIFDTGGQTSKVVIATLNDICYISAQQYLLAYDVKNPLSPRRIAQLTLPGTSAPYKIATSGNDCIILYDNQHTVVYLIDSTSVTISSSITLSDFYPAGMSPLFASTKTHVFIASSQNLLIYDITQRKNPSLVSTIPLPIEIMDGNLILNNDLCYISTNGVYLVVDIATISNPFVVNTAFSDVPNSGKDSFIHQDYCFLTTDQGLSITPRGNTLTLLGTPPGGTQGNYLITLTATDKQSRTAKATLNLFINPAITVQAIIPNQFAVIGSNFNFFIGSNTFKHINNNVLTYYVDSIPDWLRFNTISGSFSGTPGLNDAGMKKIRVFAKDGNGASANTDFDLRVVHGPTLNNPIAEQIAKIGIPFSFTFPADTFIDKDGDTLEYSVTNSGTPLPNWLTFDANLRKFYGIPKPSDAGRLQLIITARAPHGLIANTIASINVVYGPSFNQPIKGQIARVGFPFSYMFPSETFIDLDGIPLTYTAMKNSSEPLPHWLFQFSSVMRTFSGFPTSTDIGRVPIKLVAQDLNRLTAETQFQIDVLYGPSVNRLISNQVVRINDFFTYTFPEDAFADKDGETLEYAATNNGLPLPSWLHFDRDKRTFSGTPSENDLGTVQVVVHAKDSHGLVAETNFQIQAVLPTSLVLLNPIANQIALVGQVFKFHVPSNTFVVPPGLIVLYSAKLKDGSSLPTWLTFVNETFLGKPGRGDTDTFSDRILEVALTASAGSGISTHVFDIDVSGDSYVLLVIKIVGPIFTSLGVLYAIYQKRSKVLNRWNKKKFLRPTEQAIIGQPFSRTFSVPGKQVKAVMVRHKGKQLAQNGQLPYGFRHNQYTNAIESDRVPDPGIYKVLTIQVIGEADKILEQFNLNITNQLQEVVIEAKVRPPKKKKKQGGVTVQMDEISTGLMLADSDYD